MDCWSGVICQQQCVSKHPTALFTSKAIGMGDDREKCYTIQVSAVGLVSSFHGNVKVAYWLVILDKDFTRDDWIIMNGLAIVPRSSALPAYYYAMAVYGSNRREIDINKQLPFLPPTSTNPQPRQQSTEHSHFAANRQPPTALLATPVPAPRCKIECALCKLRRILRTFSARF